MPKETVKKPSFISDRLKLVPCPIGEKGFCCKICLMGPCRLMTPEQKGVCGASQDLVVARNVLRFIAGGAAAHAGHTYHLIEHFNEEYPHDYIRNKAPDYLYKLWDDLNILPKVKMEHFKDISEALHTSTMGVNSDWQDVLKWCMKLGVVDGYYGLYLGTELEDKHFGLPTVKTGQLNLGVLDPKKVNIAIHGHESTFAEAIVQEAAKYDIVNLVGVCCTGASLLARHGVPLAGNFILQEDVVATGIVDALVVDTQCIMPSLSDLCDCFHTKLITTNDIAKIPGALHMPIKTQAQARETADRIIKLAIGNKQNRRKNVEELFAKQKHEIKEVVVGFTEDTIPLEEIISKYRRGKIKGIIAVVGCVNPRAEQGWIEVYKKLSKDYVILTTGCMAFEFGKNNLLDGKNVFHLGSCINNSRVAEVFRKISSKMGKEITELPFLVSCPMPITEKAIAIGFFFAGIGCDVHVGYPFLLSSDSNVAGFLANTLRAKFKSRIFVDTSPESFYNKIKDGLVVSPE